MTFGTCQGTSIIQPDTIGHSSFYFSSTFYNYPIILDQYNLLNLYIDVNKVLFYLDY